MARVADEIEAEVSGWLGVVTVAHRFGGREFRLGRRELGHVHGDTLVDIPFPVAIRRRLVADGRALPHHVLPESGWVSVYLERPGDVARAVALLRLNYERPWLARDAEADVVAEASEESFPASDTPAFVPIVGVRPVRKAEPEPNREPEPQDSEPSS